MFIVPRASSVYGAVRDTSESGAWSETAGFVKVVTRLGGRLLGAAIVGPHAGELIHEYTLALTKKMNITELSRVIHIYPTLSQINRRVADERMKQKLTPTAKNLVQWIFGLQGPASTTAGETHPNASPVSRT